MPNDQDEEDAPPCTVRCSKIVGEDSNKNPIYCQNTCCKKATPQHVSYGTHYCSTHS